MEKKITAPAVLTLFFAIFFTACLKPPVNIDPRDANYVYTACRIKQILTYPGYPYSTAYHGRTFEYNANNDPVNVYSDPRGISYLDLSFKYDGRKRLVQYCAYYYVPATNNFEILHRYGYTRDRITIDTVYSMGSFDAAGNPYHYQLNWYSYLTYDKLNRVVKDSLVYVLPHFPGESIQYMYDQRGNLLNTNSDPAMKWVYDTQLNLHRTNTIWMFVDRNYSVNNPVIAAGYNGVGLPLYYHALGEEVSNFDFSLAYAGYSDSTRVIYDCR